MVNKKARMASIRILFVSLILALFVAFNGLETRTIVGMMAYAIVIAILILFLSQKTFREYSLIGDGLSVDVLFGALVGLSFVVLRNLNSIFTIGAPLTFGVEELAKFIAVVLVAPVVEEFLFRGLIYPWLYNQLGKNNLVAIPLQAVLFALFHLFAYGGIVGLTNAPALFVGAFTWGVVAALMVMQSPKIADVTTLERPIVAHMIINFALLNATLSLVVIG